MHRWISRQLATAAALTLLLAPTALAAPGALPADIQALSDAGVREGLPPLSLPASYTSLPANQQLFVLLNLERQRRGLPPAIGLARSLDTAAAAGAASGQDPQLPGNFAAAASVWGEAGSMPQVVYLWMYDDGWNGAGATPNLDCTGPSAPGCGGHRRAILGSYGSSPLMGAAVAGASGGVSAAAVFTTQPLSGGQPALDVSWNQVSGGGQTPPAPNPPSPPAVNPPANPPPVNPPAVNPPSNGGGNAGQRPNGGNGGGWGGLTGGNGSAGDGGTGALGGWGGLMGGNGSAGDGGAGALGGWGGLMGGDGSAGDSGSGALSGWGSLIGGSGNGNGGSAQNGGAGGLGGLLGQLWGGGA